MNYAPGFIWKYPGFPSLVVPYQPTNDYFFSGHMGGALIATLEWKKNGYKSMMYLGIATMFL
jgi:hypothetical protein